MFFHCVIVVQLAMILELSVFVFLPVRAFFSVSRFLVVMLILLMHEGRATMEYMRVLLRGLLAIRKKDCGLGHADISS